MMKILLAEDEPPILRDLKFQIEQASDLFCVCASAYNGKQAMEYLDDPALNPDVLITDIQMPLVNGLELIRYAKSKHPSITCIILTGYGEFSYAQEALRMGVSDYLLKPVDEDCLRKLLTKIYHEKYSQKIQDQFPYNQVHPSGTASIYPRFYATALIGFGMIPMYESTTYTFSPYLEATEFLEQTLQELLTEKDTFWIINGKSSGEKAVIFHLHFREPERIRLFFEQFFEKIRKKSTTTTMAVDVEVEDINETGSSFLQLRHFLVERIVLEQCQLLFLSKTFPEKKPVELRILAEEIQNLANIFSTKQLSLFQNSLKAFLNHMQQMRLPQNQLFKCIYDLLNSCGLCFTELGYSLNCMECANDTLTFSETYEQLFSNLSSVFEDIFESLLSRQNNEIRKDHISLMLDLYIKNNFTQPVNTQIMADKFGFSPAYLSKIFREYKNMSPMEYIVFLRIEKAKELFLQSPGILIKDVSTAIGYEDPHYFSKVFKKLTGLSPKQFLYQQNCIITK